MKTILATLLLLSSTQLLASQKNFSQCTNNKVDNTTTIFICDKEQYLVSYNDSRQISSTKITLITNGQAIILKDTSKK